jgi:hypothetical protein
MSPRSTGAPRNWPVASTPPKPSRSRFQPASEELGRRVAEMADTYATQLARIATLIHCKPSASITEFARAFDLKKDR